MIGIKQLRWSSTHLPWRLNSIKCDRLDSEVIDQEFRQWASGANVFEQVMYRVQFHGRGAWAAPMAA